MPDITTFLLVEDDPNDVFLVELEFKNAPGHIRLRTVNDGCEAIDYLGGKGRYHDRVRFPLPDVILLDLKMPKVCGFEFLEWLRQKSPDELQLIPVVVMSSSALESDVRRAYSLHVNSYMIKPVKWQEFRERIRTLGVYWAEHVQKP